MTWWYAASWQSCTRPVSTDDKKVSDHHAIIPTEQFVDLTHMTIDERRIYDLVVRRFLAVLYPPCEYEQTEITVRAGEELFTAHGNVIKEAGWRAVYENPDGGMEEDTEEAGGDGSSAAGQILPDLKEGDVLQGVSFAMTEGKTKPPAHFNEATLLSAMENGSSAAGQILPDLKEGDVLQGVSFAMTEGKTKPPAHFNEATLLSAMENPVAAAGQILPDLKEGDVLQGVSFAMTEGKTKPPAHFNEATLLSAMENPVAYMESQDKAMAKTLGETGGLGTVATRADIIEKLFSSFLLEKKGKDILLTSKARQLLELVPEDLKKPELTADWEMKLSRIARGELSRTAFMTEIRSYSEELTGEIRRGEGKFRHDNMTSKKCPRCGKNLLLVKGKNSEMLVCQDRECGYRETISRTSNARCPVCHKRMELRGKGDGQIFVCSCGHKEKLSAFQERRKKEGASVSKRDVTRYMNQQRKEAEEPVNNAFAKALAGLKLDPKR